MTNSYLRLENYHVLITGASGGVGVATAHAFLEQGSKVTLHYNSNCGNLGNLLREYPENVVALKANVLDEMEIQKLIVDSVSRFGPINILVLNHGIWPASDIPIKDMELSHWNNTIGVNLTGCFLFAREYLKQLEAHNVNENVSVVIVGSTAGKFGEAFHADYACSKSALMGGFTLSLKNEIVKVSPRGRVNTVAPGWIRTPMAETAMKNPKILSQAMATSPLNKVSEPSDIANSILFLASEAASGNITGHVLDVNAGMEGRLLNSVHQ